MIRASEELSTTEQFPAANDKKERAFDPLGRDNYRKDVAVMRGALDDEDAAERPDLIAPLRPPIHSVIVHAQPNVKGFEVR